MPGTLTNVARTSDVIIGLLLLMLARGLRRRKRRAWQAVARAARVRHRHPLPCTSRTRASRSPRFVAIVLLAVLLYRHEDFYAVGDPRTRRTARCRSSSASSSHGLRDRPRLPGRSGRSPGTTRSPSGCRTCCTSWSASYGPVQWASDARGDLYHLLTSALGAFTLVVTIYLFLRSARPRARLAAADAAKIRELLDQARRPGLARLLRAARRQERDLVAVGQVGYLLPGGGRRDARLRRPARRPRGLAGRHRRVPRRGGAARLAARGDGLQRARRRGVVPGGRPDRAGARRRGDRQRRGLQPLRPLDAQRQADGQPRRQERLHRGGPPGRRHTAAGA